MAQTEKQKEEIATTLQKENVRVNDLNRANASLMSASHQTTDDITLHMAHSIWINHQFHFQSHFTQHIEDYFNGNTEEIDVFD